MTKRSQEKSKPAQGWFSRKSSNSSFFDPFFFCFFCILIILVSHIFFYFTICKIRGTNNLHSSLHFLLMKITFSLWSGVQLPSSGRKHSCARTKNGGILVTLGPTVQVAPVHSFLQTYKDDFREGIRPWTDTARCDSWHPEGFKNPYQVHLHRDARTCEDFRRHRGEVGGDRSWVRVEGPHEQSRTPQQRPPEWWEEVRRHHQGGWEHSHGVQGDWMRISSKWTSGLQSILPSILLHFIIFWNAHYLNGILICNKYCKDCTSIRFWTKQSRITTKGAPVVPSISFTVSYSFLSCFSCPSSSFPQKHFYF